MDKWMNIKQKSKQNHKTIKNRQTRRQGKIVCILTETANLPGDDGLTGVVSRLPLWACPFNQPSMEA